MESQFAPAAVASVDAELDAIREVTTDTPATKPLTMFDILGIPKPKLLMALYNAAISVGSSPKMSLNQATEIMQGEHTPYCWLDQRGDFSGYDAVQSEFGGGGAYTSRHEHERRHVVNNEGVYRNKKMNVNIGGDTLDVTGYDAANGEGAAFAAIKHLLEERDKMETAAP